MTTEFNTGDHVRVTKPDDCSFGDYDIGSTAVVTAVHHPVGAPPFVYVTWDGPHYHEPESDDARCTLLFFDEIELVPA